MLRYILILSLGLLAMQSLGQDTLALAGVKDISVFNVDAKGNIFVADKEHTLYKYDANGKLLMNVNIKAYGEIYSIDCSNPFEIYVFHKEQNIVVFYDNMLNIRGSIHLNDYYFNTACVARSFDNNIWILDLTQFKLLKINKQGDILAESPYLNNTLTQSLQVYKVWEHNNDVYLADSNAGIFTFDMYATFRNSYYIENLENACHIKSEMALIKNGQIQRYNELLLIPVPLKVRVENPTTFEYQAGRLYYALGSSIVRFPISEK